MARPKAAVGELGAVQYTRLASGAIRARARMRDDGGAVHQLRAVGSSEQAALAELRRKALALTTGGGSGLSPSSTIAEAGEAWLRQLAARARSGSLAHSTYASYETVLRLTLVPRCGPIPLEALTVGRCDRIIQALLTEETLSKARRARAVLSLICGYAVRDDAMPLNPVRDVQRLPLPEKKSSALTPEQITAIRDLMHTWRQNCGYEPRPDYRALIDGMDIMLGSSARVGECLGLRRCDVDMITTPPTLLIDGTIVQTKAEGLHRKNAPKRTRRRRRIALPAAAASAVRRRLALAGKGAEAFLFPTKTGRPMSVSNYERLLRSFVDGNRDSLIALCVSGRVHHPPLPAHHRDPRRARRRAHARLPAARARQRADHTGVVRRHRRKGRSGDGRHPGRGAGGVIAGATGMQSDCNSVQSLGNRAATVVRTGGPSYRERGPQHRLGDEATVAARSRPE